MRDAPGASFAPAWCRTRLFAGVTAPCTVARVPAATVRLDAVALPLYGLGMLASPIICIFRHPWLSSCFLK